MTTFLSSAAASRAAIALRRGSIGASDAEGASASTSPQSSWTGSARAPNWTRFVEAKGEFVTAADVDAIRAYERQPNESVQELLATEPGSGVKYARALLKVLRNISEPKVVEYALELVRDFVEPDPYARVELFADADTGVVDLTPMLRCLNSESAVVREAASLLLAVFLSVRADAGTDAAVDEFVEWTVQQLASHRNSQNHSSIKSTMGALTTVLSSAQARAAFQRHGGVRVLAPYVANTPGKNSQTLYDATLCVWMMTMHKPALADVDLQTIRELCQLVADKPREKILRVAAAALRNVVTRQPEREKELCEFLLSTDLARTLEALKSARLTDAEVLQDLTKLQEVLEANFRVLSSFERYSKELQTGKLKWGPMHKELFWKENVREVERDDFAAVKRLAAIVDATLAKEGDGVDPTFSIAEDSAPPTDDDYASMAIACNDLGFFVQFHPSGKQIAVSLGVKQRVMRLLDHKNELVRKHALQCASKMLVTAWEFIDAGSTSGSSGAAA